MSHSLYGISCVQVYIYYQRSSRDSRTLKTLVSRITVFLLRVLNDGHALGVSLMVSYTLNVRTVDLSILTLVRILDTAQLVFWTVALYNFCVTNFSNLPALLFSPWYVRSYRAIFSCWILTFFIQELCGRFENIFPLHRFLSFTMTYPSGWLRCRGELVSSTRPYLPDQHFLEAIEWYSSHMVLLPIFLIGLYFWLHCHSIYTYRLWKCTYRQPNRISYGWLLEQWEEGSYGLRLAYR